MAQMLCSKYWSLVSVVSGQVRNLSLSQEGEDGKGEDRWKEYIALSSVLGLVMQT